MTISEAANAVQKAIYQTLSNIPELENVKIVDYVPENIEMPYIQIGEDDIIDDSSKTATAYSATCTVNIYSNYKGMKKVKELSAFVIAALRNIAICSDLGFNVRTLKVDRLAFATENYDNVVHCTIDIIFRITKNGGNYD